MPNNGIQENDPRLEYDLRRFLEYHVDATPDAFPPNGEKTYFQQFDLIEKHLNTHFHPKVELGATLSDGGFLTDHGVDHINTVISRAGFLSNPIAGFLRPYEVYILLVAIHFHDMGNIFGRENHETKCGEIMFELGPLAGGDDYEKNLIIEIASAHGGYFDGDKDTIGPLPYETDVLGKDIRPQLLAAILRFADEIAEDKYRSPRYITELDNGGVFTGKSRKSQIYHKYAQSLNSVMVKPQERKISFKFILYKKACVDKFYKGRKKIFLLDEIYERILKTHVENIYCMRFFPPERRIDKIWIEIHIYQEKGQIKPIEIIPFKLMETGYPDFEDCCMTELCSDELWC